MVARSTSTPGSRPPSCCCRSGAATGGDHRAPSGGSHRVSAPSRRLGPPLRSPHTLYPHAHFLSNGAYTAIVTNAGGGYSSCRGRVVTRAREDRTRDIGSQFVYLRDVRTGLVWSATYQPDVPGGGGVPGHLHARARRLPPPGRRDRDAARDRRLPEDDVEVRRLALTNARPARESRSRATPSRSSPSRPDDLAHPAFRQAVPGDRVRPHSAALLCRRRPRAAEEPDRLRCTC